MARFLPVLIETPTSTSRGVPIEMMTEYPTSSMPARTRLVVHVIRGVQTAKGLIMTRTETASSIALIAARTRTP